ncbi:MAG: sulfide/dihydroorotate dehydrogenase-like FAD/NAD-binding protein [Endomicrobium sp.]|jgi:ferredoxin--NADP+ reductase|nr:sulfide/dihydroorotate dehydrogenase-like FAD/NAD-binding protein [Endomicrobium sp.]
MYKIVSIEEIGPKIRSYEICAPNIAKNAKAGQFVMLRVNDIGERIPLTIAGTNLEKGLVKIIFQEVGKTTMQLASLSTGKYIRDFMGPLGHPTEIKKYGTVVSVAGGVGAAEILSVIKELKSVGNRIITIMGARCKDLIILKDELRQQSDSILFTTNDGTYGTKGYVTDALKEIINKEKVDIIYAIGPVSMMKAVSEITRKKNIKTIVSLNPIMLDGTGMCGACRVTIHDEIKFACVDGPEFDANLVDWEELVSRLDLFKNLEKIAIDNFKRNQGCNCCKK